MKIYKENKKEINYYFRILPREQLAEFGPEASHMTGFDYLAAIVDSEGKAMSRGFLFGVRDGEIKTFAGVDEELARNVQINLNSTNSIKVRAG